MMATEEGGSGEETTTTATATITPSGSAPGSPKINKVKFLCSHGGKILPRPADGQLKYVGGQTRAVSIPRGITFSELMKKLASLTDGEIVLKYQLIPEEFDALVSVKSDEDLRYMLHEYDCHESAGTPRLRAFLFPATPVVVKENQMSYMDPRALLEQRYVDAINGIIRAMNRNPSSSAASSSPSSPKRCTIDYAIREIILQNGQVYMPRVQSSPTIPSNHQPRHHCYQNYQQQLQHNGYQSPRAHTPERLVSVRSMGAADSGKYPVIPTQNNYYPIHS